MRLRRRDWPTRGWLYEMHKIIRWRLVKRFPLMEAKVAPAPVVAPPPPPVVAKKSKKASTDQLGFGF